MKKTLVTAALLAALATAAPAGNPEPAPAEPVVVAEPAPQDGRLLVPVLAFLFAVAAISNN